MLTVGQQSQVDGFRAPLGLFGRTIWVGAPEYQSAKAILEEITELDPEFELVKDIREVCRLSILAEDLPNVAIRPMDQILDGENPQAPEARWQVIPSSRRNNPTTPIVSWIVQKIV